MNEQTLVRLVARTVPWLAPVPSAYFVGRSAYALLGVHLAVAVVIALVIELMGLSTVHAALRAYNWNRTKLKSDEPAHFALSAVLVGSYLTVTLFLLLVLEVWPDLARYAPALFPPLALVGAVTLATMDHQDRREKDADRAKDDRKRARAGRKIEKADERPVDLPPVLVKDKLDRAIMSYVQSEPDASYRAIAEAVGSTKTTVGTRVQRLKMVGTWPGNGDRP